MPRFHRAKEGDKIPISDYNMKSDYLEALVNLKVTGGKFFIDRGGASLDIDSGVKTEIRWAKLLEDLAAADAESVNTPATADAVFLVAPADGSEPLVETDPDEPITIVNRRADYTAEADDIILVCRVNLDKSMEWTPIDFTLTEETPDDGLPPGTEGCNCGNCLAGVTIPDALECCTSHLRWSLKNPWLACAETDLELEYAGNDTWLTDPFDGPDCEGVHNEYRWELTIDVDGRSYLTLLVETDNGCDPVCIVYGRDGFNCQCNNSFTIEKPFGTHIGVPRDELSCLACIKPNPQVVTAVCRNQQVASVYRVTLIEAGTYPNVAEYFPDGGELFVSWVDFPDAPCGGSPCGYGFRAPGAWWVIQPYWSNPNQNTGGGLVCEGPSTATLAFGLCLNNIEADPRAHISFHSNTFDWEVGGELIQGTQCSTGFDDTLFEPAVVLVEPVDGREITSPLSDGVCNESCGVTPEVPPDGDAGGCCIEGVCYERVGQPECTAFGGEWYAEGCAECEVLNPAAPCCVLGTCIHTDPWTCTQVLGGTSSVSGDCDDGVCNEGACCSAADGTCSQQFEADCTSPNYFWGANTDCSPNPCPALGACCQNDQDLGMNCGVGDVCECVLTLEANCIGTFAGAATNCGTSTGCDCRAAVCDFL